LIGLSLKTIIQLVVGLEAGQALQPGSNWLYYQATPLPTTWANLLRWLPIAVLLQWPSFHGLPVELREQTRLDRLSWWSAWSKIYESLTRLAALRAGLLVAMLCLAELSASKLVAPPGFKSAILRYFAQMHYGTEAAVACHALLIWLTCAAAAVVWLQLEDRNEQRPKT
jgi:iron(III) transport system permease protein